MPEPLRLNRTFYGIETVAIIAATWCLLVLIVPFMELKLEIGSMVKRTWPCLNRTFYGIETISGRCEICTFFVLIVPFMELKLINRAHDVALGGVLIVPFMELKRKGWR